MPLEVVTGPAFSGKARYVRNEIGQREAAGRYGQLLIDYTAIYAALAPGEQSQLRDQAVSDSGAPRLAAFMYDTALAAAVVRELDGFITTNSPRRAVAIAERVGAELVYELRVGVDDLADRTEDHLSSLRRRVPRADRATMRRRCRGAVVTYFNEAGSLRDRAVRPVHQSGRGYRVGRPPRAAHTTVRRFSVA